MSDHDPIDHMATMRRLARIQTIFAPAAALVVVGLTLMFCYPRPGLVGDYGAIIAGFAGVVTYLLGIAGVIVLGNSSEKKVKAWELKMQSKTAEQGRADRP
jgi:hypothetical protein